MILSLLVAVFQATEYPLRVEDGASWRQFWWYNSAGGWPLDENDTLGSNFSLLLHYLTLKAPITTAADDNFCDVFSNFRKKKGTCMIFH